jgi:MFS family permease
MNLRRALLAAMLLGGTFLGITALGFAAARAFAPEDQRRAFALTTAGFGVGQIIGPVVGGLLLDCTGGFAAASLLAAGALLMCAVHRHHFNFRNANSMAYPRT